MFVCVRVCKSMCICVVVYVCVCVCVRVRVYIKSGPQWLQYQGNHAGLTCGQSLPRSTTLSLRKARATNDSVCGFAFTVTVTEKVYIWSFVQEKWCTLAWHRRRPATTGVRGRSWQGVWWWGCCHGGYWTRWRGCCHGGYLKQGFSSYEDIL